MSKPDSEGRERARAAVQRRMDEKELSIIRVAELGGTAGHPLDPGTVGGWLNGKTKWPIARVRRGIERALGWKEMTIDNYASGNEAALTIVRSPIARAENPAPITLDNASELQLLTALFDRVQRARQTNGS